MKKLFSLIMLTACLEVNLETVAQQTGFGWENLIPSEISSTIRITGDITHPDPYSNANYYLSRDWLKGSLFLKGGNRHDNVFLRYNAFHDQLMIYNTALNVPCLVDRETIEGFEMKDPVNGLQKFRRIDLYGEKTMGRFYRILHDGIYALLAYHKIVEAKTALHKDIFGILRDTEFRQTVSYFLYHPEKSLIKITPRKKSFFAVFRSDEKIVKKLFKQHNLRHLDENEMVRALALLESEGIIK